MMFAILSSFWSNVSCLLSIFCCMEKSYAFIAGTEVCPWLELGNGERTPCGVFSAMFIELVEESGPLFCIFLADLKAPSLS